jgi:hypothetical protein
MMYLHKDLKNQEWRDIPCLVDEKKQKFLREASPPKSVTKFYQMLYLLRTVGLDKMKINARHPILLERNEI